MEISNEMRVRIFAAYLDSRVLIPCNKISHLVGVSFINDQVETLLPGASIRKVYKVAECQLLLTPLPEITDEHAVEVARILDFSGTRVMVGDDYITVDSPNNDDWNKKDTLRIYFKEYEIWSLDEYGKVFEYDAYRLLMVIDYLRSKSYHVPYMGIDLFEAGIAVEIKSEGGGDD